MNEQMKQAMNNRHTVRKFNGTPLSESEKSLLRARVDELNKQFDLSVTLIESDKTPVNFMGKVVLGGKGVYSYFVLAADDRDGVDEMLGYAGSDLCLYAQMNGLNTWWMAGTFNRKYVEGFVSGKKIVKHHFELGAGEENFEWA